MVKAKYVRYSEPILRGMILIVALCAFIKLLPALLYGGKWGVALLIFALASFTLMAMIPKRATLPAIEGERTTTERQHQLPDWSLLSYCFITGLGYTWVCSFLWFSRRYAFFSAPVICVTVLILASCAAIGYLTARLTGGSWRTALLVFALAPCALGGIVLRLGLLR